MAFSSLVFLLIFFPLVIGAYHIVPQRLKNVFLLLASLFFYAWGGFHALPLFVASMVANYCFALLIGKYLQRERLCRLIVVFAIAANVALLVAFKYLGFILKCVNAATGLSLPAPGWALPLGISFFTFSALSYILDVYFGAAKAEKNFFHVALYLAFFPKLVSGPIMQWSAFRSQLDSRSCTVEQFSAGLKRFIVGLAKKLVVADSLASFADFIFDRNDFASVSALLAWFGVIVYIVQLYYDFSGYSDMAVGLGKMLGFTVDENFNYPFASKRIAEYWGRWHITLGTWVKHYIYTPVFRALNVRSKRTGKKRDAKYCDYAALLVSWCIIGPWHGAGFHYLAYGLFYCAFIIIERVWDNYKKKRAKAGKPLRWNPAIAACCSHLYFFVVLCIGQMLFRANSLTLAYKQLRAMFGLGASGFANATDAFYVSIYLPLILMGIIGGLPLIPFLRKKLASWDGMLRAVLSAILHIALLLLSVAFAVGNTYKAFIYFNF